MIWRGKQRETMIQKANFHTHTTFCDGRDTMEDIITDAIGALIVSVVGALTMKKKAAPNEEDAAV